MLSARNFGTSCIFYVPSVKTTTEVWQGARELTPGVHHTATVDARELTPRAHHTATASPLTKEENRQFSAQLFEK